MFGILREDPFLPRVVVSPPSFLEILRSSSGKFSTTDWPLILRMVAIVAAALHSDIESELSTTDWLLILRMVAIVAAALIIYKDIEFEQIKWMNTVD